jgi:hypothetical protein
LEHLHKGGWWQYASCWGPFFSMTFPGTYA